MLFGCFYFSPFIGGEVVNFINNLRYLSKCPRCNQGTVFDGLIKLKDYALLKNKDIVVEKLDFKNKKRELF